MTTENVHKQPIVLENLSAHGVLRLTLNNPAKRNALSEAMLTQLHLAITAAAVDPLVRVVILAASGPVFCAGHDLKELTHGRKESDKGR